MLTLTISLPLETLNRLNAEAEKRGAELTSCAGQLIQEALDDPLGGRTADAPEPAEPHVPFWQRLIEAGERVPEEEWARLPVGLAENHDYYLYGEGQRELYGGEKPKR